MLSSRFLLNALKKANKNIFFMENVELNRGKGDLFFRKKSLQSNRFFTTKNKKTVQFFNTRFNSFNKSKIFNFNSLKPLVKKNDYHDDHCKPRRKKFDKKKFFNSIERIIERAGAGFFAGMVGSVANPFTWEGMIYCCPVHWTYMFTGALTGIFANQIIDDYDTCLGFIIILFSLIFFFFVFPNYKYLLRKIQEKQNKKKKRWYERR